MTTKAEILKAIRAKCLDCSCYQPNEVRICHLVKCALHPFRMGADPNPARSRGPIVATAAENTPAGGGIYQSEVSQAPRLSPQGPPSRQLGDFGETLAEDAAQ
jgi:hypothetical protein